MRAGVRVLPWVAVSLALSGDLAAQSVLQRTPNLGGGWEGSHGTLFFNFMHRFNNTGVPSRKVVNRPTFLLGAGLPGNLLLAANYATNSDVVSSYPNEWEFLVRSLPLKQFTGFPVDVSAQVGYNLAAESVDGELQLARDLGPLRVMGSARAFSQGYDRGEGRLALGGGALLRLANWFAIGGDIVALAETYGDERTAWSGALQFGIPYTPHSISLHVANTSTATLQGSSRGLPGHHWGFEFTIPVHLARYFGEKPVSAPAPIESVDTPVDTPVVARTQIRTDTITVRTDTVMRVDTPRAVVRDSVRPTIPPVRAGQTDTTRRTPPQTTRPPTTPPQQQQQPQPQPAARTVTSRMRNLVFEPARVQIPVGSTVVWRNEDQVAHTVKAANGSWESPMIQPGGTYRRTFTRAGTFQITCGPHPFMKQVVEVK